MENRTIYKDKVCRITAAIPSGYVMTYGQIALILGNPRHARLVGQIMSNAHPGLPCHRVVNSLGKLSPDYVFGGTQRLLLEEEGVTFLKNGRINLKKHLWSPEKTDL